MVKFVGRHNLELLGPGVQCETCDSADRLACLNIALTIMTLCRYAPDAADAAPITRGIFCSRIMDHRNKLKNILSCLKING